MDPNIDFAKVEAFVRNEMEEKERISFLEAIESNHELAEQVKLYELENRAAELMVQMQVKEQLALFKAAELEEKSSVSDQTSKEEAKVVDFAARRRKWMARWAAAASILLVIGFFGTYLIQGSLGGEDIRNYLQSPATSSKGAIAEADPLFQPALNKMEAGDYEGALVLLEAMDGADTNPLSQQYIGECYLQLKAYQKAIPIFEDLVQSLTLNNPAGQKADWYLTLAYYATDDQRFESAIASIINNSNHIYQDAAKAFKTKIN